MAALHRSERAGSRVFGGVPKVPAVTPYFWAVKLLTTCMGEAVSDFVVLDVNKYLGVVMGFAVFAAAIVWQFRTPRYRTWPYWTAVSMVAVFGTMAADVMHVVLGLPYLAAAVFYALCLAVTFAAWYRAEGTLDIHSIVTRRREVFYWLAVIFTFAMGTALGDLFATTFNLGYLASAVMFTALICVPLIAWRLGVNPVLTFWVAYILTRPIGASLADFFGMAKGVSGMGYGHGAVSAVTLVLVVASFIYLSRSGIDRPGAQSPAAPAVPAGHGQPRYGQAQYAQPRYGQPAQGRPRYPRPQYAQAQYGQPQYGGPAQGEPRYGETQYGETQYGDPAQGRPYRPPSRSGDAGQDEPRYRGSRQGGTRYAADPRHRDRQ